MTVGGLIKELERLVKNDETVADLPIGRLDVHTEGALVKGVGIWPCRPGPGADAGRIVLIF